MIREHIPTETKVIMRLYKEGNYGVAEEYYLYQEPDTEQDSYFFEFVVVGGAKHKIPKHLIRHITFIKHNADYDVERWGVKDE